MKEYRVKFQSVIEGRPVHKGDTVRLSDERAKVYKSAGLIEAADADEKKPDAKTESKA